MKLFRTIEAVADGNYTLGDILTFALTDGEDVEALAVKQEQDGMVFVLMNCLRKEYPMNQYLTNKGGYEYCDLRKTLNGEILYRLPTGIREKMVAFLNGDLLCLPTEREIFGENPYGKDENDAVQQWETMKLRKNRIASHGKNGGWEWYWLQNEVEDSADRFSCVNDSGIASYLVACSAMGVRPVFKIQNHVSL